MTTIRATAAAILAEILPGWEILDSAPVQPAPRPQVLILTAWDRLEIQGPPHPGMAREGVLRLFCSWPVSSQASGGAWMAAADTLERLLWGALTGSAELLEDYEISSWSSERGIDRLDSGLLARLDIEIRGMTDWAAPSTEDAALDAISATIEWGIKAPKQNVHLELDLKEE